MKEKCPQMFLAVTKWYFNGHFKQNINARSWSLFCRKYLPWKRNFRKSPSRSRNITVIILIFKPQFAVMIYLPWKKWMHVKEKCPQMFLAVTKWHYNGHTVPSDALIWFKAASVLQKTVGLFHFFHRRNVISLLQKIYKKIGAMFSILSFGS